MATEPPKTTLHDSQSNSMSLHDGAGDRNAAALVAVTLDALRLAARRLGWLDDGVDDGDGRAAGAVAVDERGAGG